MSPECENPADQDPVNLFGVWPTDLRDEWNRRTWYGKSHFLALLPFYVGGWVVLLVLAALMAVGYYGLVATWKLYTGLSKLKPNKHRVDGDEKA